MGRSERNLAVPRGAAVGLAHLEAGEWRELAVDTTGGELEDELDEDPELAE